MEKTISITIASRAFVLAESAYEQLAQYLESLKAHFADDLDRDEIMRDIESRIAELLEQHTGVIPLSVIEGVIANMGTIADFEHEDGKEGAAPLREAKDLVGKKFYRNPDDLLIAGVCSGLAAYVGVDATWVRLAFVVMTFMSGFGILFYLILWIITPEAKTKAQKLEMEGSPVTLETLSETVRVEAEGVKQRSEGSIRRVLALPLSVIGKMVGFFTRVVPAILRIFVGVGLFFAGIGGLVLIMLMSGFLLSGDARIGQYVPLPAIFPGMLLYGTLTALTLVFLVPVLLVFLGGVSLLRKKNVIAPSVGFVILGVWLLALLVSGFGVAKGIQNYGVAVSAAPEVQVHTVLIPLSGTFTKIDVRDGVTLRIVEGASTTLSATGRDEERSLLVARVEEDTLKIGMEQNRITRDRFCVLCFREEEAQTLTLTVPTAQIRSVSARGNSRVESEDAFVVSEELSLRATNGSRVELEGSAPKLLVDLEGNSFANLSFVSDHISATMTNGSTLALSGAGDILVASLRQGSSLDAEGFKASEAEIVASHGASATVWVVQTLDAIATAGSSIIFTGNPEHVTKEADEGSSVGER